MERVQQCWGRVSVVREGGWKPEVMHTQTRKGLIR